MIRDAVPIFLPDNWMDGSYGIVYLRTMEQQVEVDHVDAQEGGRRLTFEL